MDIVETETSKKSLFSSLSAIKIIWNNEIKNIKLMEKIIEEMKTPPKELEM